VDWIRIIQLRTVDFKTMWRYKKRSEICTGCWWGKKPLEMFRRRWKNYIKTVVSGRGCERVDQIYCIWLKIRT